ncbi:hypothetical protein ACFRCI_19070 [Streptomyces sp. NPDC056638]|uniref:hypothetical protein n=1 Tax=Streptomyces sp. NPDC056638 TaxID=3345887 RepID=UPI0036739944
MTLTECSTHAQVDAAVGGFNSGEPELAIKMADSTAGMLVIMDRGFPGVAWSSWRRRCIGSSTTASGVRVRRTGT